MLRLMTMQPRAKQKQKFEGVGFRVFGLGFRVIGYQGMELSLGLRYWVYDLVYWVWGGLGV